MKKSLFLSILLFAYIIIFAQTPTKINYQGAIRNNLNEVIANKQIQIKVSILQGSQSGTAVYIETQNPTTNENGLFSIEIGSGTSVTGNISSINWGTNTYYIKTEIDPEGGTNYILNAVSQLISVPYALHSKTAETVLNNGVTGNETIFDNWDKNSTDDVALSSPSSGDMLYFNGTSWESIPAGNNNQVLLMKNNKPTWVDTTGGIRIGGHYVGELYGGGIVAYVYDNGLHGLIASLDNLNSGNTTN